MHCGVIIHTECCKSNCLKAEEKDSRCDEYEATDVGSDEIDEEIDKNSLKTTAKFPDEWRP